MMVFKDLNLKFYKGKFSLKIKELDLTKCFVIGISGKNGSGKSTFASFIGDVISPSEISGYIYREKGIKSYVFNSMQLSLFPYLSISKNVTTFCYHNNILPDKRYIQSVVKSLGLLDHYKKKVHKCSSGTKTKIEILKMIILNPDICILDEPLNGLDTQSTEFLINYIDQNRNHKLFILISHDNLLINNTSDVILNINDGNVKKI